MFMMMMMRIGYLLIHASLQSVKSRFWPGCNIKRVIFWRWSHATGAETCGAQ